MRQIKQAIHFALQNGFAHIFSANVLNKVIQFCSSVILVRLFSKTGYGQWSYANNILNIFLLFDGLGVAHGLLQYSCETSEQAKRNAYLKYALLTGISFNVLLSVLILAFSYIIHFPIENTNRIVRHLFSVPIFMAIFNIAECYLRSVLKNKQYSILSNINTALLLIASVPGLYFLGVYGLIYSRYVAWLATDVLAVVFVRNDLQDITTELEKQEKKAFLSYSVVCCANNSIANMLHLVDVFLVGMIVKESSTVASYKSASIIPFALNFIPLSLIVFVYPYFVRINTDATKFKHRFIILEKYFALFNLVVSAVLCILAPVIISIAFGKNYTDAVVPFRILSIGYFFAATFYIPCCNLLAAIKKMRVNLVISIIDGILNIVADIVLIQKYGSMGAAIATTGIYIVSGLLSAGWLLWFLNRQQNQLSKH